MSISIYGHTVKVTPALREHTEQQFNKVQKFSTLIGTTNVVLDVVNENHIAKCTIKVPGNNDIHAESTSDDMYRSIEALSLKVEQQLRKVKGLQTANRNPNSRVEPDRDEMDEWLPEHEEE